MVFGLNKLFKKWGTEWAIYELEEECPKTTEKLTNQILSGNFPIESEDDRIFCEVYKKILKERGYHIPRGL